MTKFIKVAILFAILCVSVSHSAKNARKNTNDADSLAGAKVAVKTEENKPTNDASYWGDVMNAIIQVESGGNSRAVNGKYAGAMQIAPVLVKECNNILKQRNLSKRFTLSDRFSIAKSKEMFLLIMSRYNPSKDIEKGIRIWNGGCNYRKASTNGYFRKVMRMMSKA